MTLTMLDSEVDTTIDELEEAFAAPAFTPTLLVDDESQNVEADWAVAAAVAAILGLLLAVVIYICSVCQARSFSACYRAVINFWGRGC